MSGIVEIVRRSNDAFNREDIEGVVALSDQDQSEALEAAGIES